MPDNTHSIHFATLNWDEQGTPLSSEFNDIYFSRDNGLAESRYVFIEQNRLPERWKQLNVVEHGHFIVFETGFGTGLNFLATWQCWQRLAPPGWTLHYICVEKSPLQHADLRRALQHWPELDSEAQQLLSHYPSPTPGWHRREFGKVCLQLLLGDVHDCLQQLADPTYELLNLPRQWSVDAWYLDGFAPAKNPAMWSDELFAQMSRLSRAGSTVATFTAAGIVKRGLQHAGFTINKVPGYGRKRDMLRGEKPQPELNENQSITQPMRRKTRLGETPWHLPADSQKSTDKKVIVIGGGIAGCTSAYALAERGWQVTLLERNQQIAEEASGNPQGVLYTRLSVQDSLLSRFTLSSFQYALHFYRSLLDKGLLTENDMRLNGVLQLAHNEPETKLQRQLQKRYGDFTDLVQFVCAEQASSISGIALKQDALFFPHAGWLKPSQLCKALCQHPNIHLISNYTVDDIHYQNQHWTVFPAAAQVLPSVAQASQSRHTPLQAPHLIIANATAAKEFAVTAHLPLKAIRGQISQLPASNEADPKLQCVLCYDGYITPPDQGQYCFGATFTLQNPSPQVCNGDHQDNWQGLQNTVPSLANTLKPEQFVGRTGFRCTTPDYLPMVGAVARYDAFVQDYASLRKNARSLVPLAGQYLPGLYINVGHGSRGLTSAPLCAQLLAALINYEPSPLPWDIGRALNPGRFIIRDLVRNKI